MACVRGLRPHGCRSSRPGKAKTGYNIAWSQTPFRDGSAIIERYAARWSIESRSKSQNRPSASPSPTGSRASNGRPLRLMSAPSQSAGTHRGPKPRRRRGRPRTRPLLSGKDSRRSSTCSPARRVTSRAISAERPPTPTPAEINLLAGMEDAAACCESEWDPVRQRTSNSESPRQRRWRRQIMDRRKVGYGSPHPPRVVGSRTSRIALGSRVPDVGATPTAMAMRNDPRPLSGGRFLLGLEPCPQVVEGWYARPYPRTTEGTVSTWRYARVLGPRRTVTSTAAIPTAAPPAGRGGQAAAPRVHRCDGIPVLLGAEAPRTWPGRRDPADDPAWFHLALTASTAPPSRRGSRDGPAEPRSACEVAAVVPTGTTTSSRRHARSALVALYAGGMGPTESTSTRSLRPHGLGRRGAEIHSSPRRRRTPPSRRPTEMVEDVALVGPVDKICEDIERRWRPTCVTTIILYDWPRPDTRGRIVDAVRGGQS